MLKPTPEPNISISNAHVKGLIGSSQTTKAQFCNDGRPNLSTVFVPSCHKNLPATVPFKFIMILLRESSSFFVKPTFS